MMHEKKPAGNGNWFWLLMCCILLGLVIATILSIVHQHEIVQGIAPCACQPIGPCEVKHCACEPAKACACQADPLKACACDLTKVACKCEPPKPVQPVKECACKPVDVKGCECKPMKPLVIEKHHWSVTVGHCSMEGVCSSAEAAKRERAEAVWILSRLR